MVIRIFTVLIIVLSNIEQWYSTDDCHSSMKKNNRYCTIILNHLLIASMKNKVVMMDGTKVVKKNKESNE